MKAIFPCTGTIIVTKQDVNKLRNFYTDNLENSKLFQIYNQSNYSIQIGGLTYLPKKSNLVLENVTFLTLPKLYNELSKQANINTDTFTKQPIQPLDDNFILNHPFFKTLTPLN